MGRVEKLSWYSLLGKGQSGVGWKAKSTASLGTWRLEEGEEEGLDLFQHFLGTRDRVEDLAARLAVGRVLVHLVRSSHSLLQVVLGAPDKLAVFGLDGVEQLLQLIEPFTKLL
jgi:hypothetical protein